MDRGKRRRIGTFGMKESKEEKKNYPRYFFHKKGFSDDTLCLMVEYCDKSVYLISKQRIKSQKSAFSEEYCDSMVSDGDWKEVPNFEAVLLI